MPVVARAGDEGTGREGPPAPAEAAIEDAEYGARLIQAHGVEAGDLQELFGETSEELLTRYRQHLDRVLVTHLHALKRYRPRPFDGRAVLYHAGEKDGHDPESLGWRSLAVRGLDVRSLSATHQTVLREPAVVDLAAYLAEDLP